MNLKLDPKEGQEVGTIALPPETQTTFATGSKVKAHVTGRPKGKTLVLEVCVGVKGGARVAPDDWSALTGGGDLDLELEVTLSRPRPSDVARSLLRRPSLLVAGCSVLAAVFALGALVTGPDKRAARAEQTIVELETVRDELRTLRDRPAALTAVADESRSLIPPLRSARDAATRRAARRLSRMQKRLEDEQRAAARAAAAIDRWDRGLSERADDAGWSPEGLFKALAAISTVGIALATCGIAWRKRAG